MKRELYPRLTEIRYDISNLSSVCFPDGHFSLEESIIEALRYAREKSFNNNDNPKIFKPNGSCGEVRVPYIYIPKRDYKDLDYVLSQLEMSKAYVAVCEYGPSDKNPYKNDHIRWIYVSSDPNSGSERMVGVLEFYYGRGGYIEKPVYYNNIEGETVGLFYVEPFKKQNTVCK